MQAYGQKGTACKVKPLPRSTMASAQSSTAYPAVYAHVLSEAYKHSELVEYLPSSTCCLYRFSLISGLPQFRLQKLLAQFVNQYC